MSTTSRVSTPVSVGRFVASIRAVAASSDGLVMCCECQRQMSDMAETCPHCSAAVVPTAASIADSSADAAAAVVSVGRHDVLAVSLVVAGMAAVGYFALRIVGS